MIVCAVIAVAAIALSAGPVSGVAATGLADYRAFFYTGREQTWIVPPGVRRVHVTAIGADGGTAQGGYDEGSGTFQAGVIAVRPGEKLYIEVGGHGSHSDSQPCPGVASCAYAPGGFNGGGEGAPGIGGGHSGAGGGGATDVQTMPASAGTAALSSRLVVAGGGGGAGGDGAPSQFATGGDGGGAMSTGAQGGSHWPANQAVIGGSGGDGANGTVGGVGGPAGASTGNPAVYLPGNRGAAGVLGEGGAGGGSAQLLPCPGCRPTVISGGGGGGGGGYTGGGGGGSGGIVECISANFNCSPSDSPDAGGGGGGGGGSDSAGASTPGTVGLADDPPNNGTVELDWGDAARGPVVHEPSPVASWFISSPQASPAAAPSSVSVTVPVICRAACDLTIQLSVPSALLGGHAGGRAIIGARSFALSTAGSGTLRITLNASGKRLLSRRRRIVATLTVTETSAKSPQAIASIPLQAT